MIIKRQKLFTIEEGGPKKKSTKGSALLRRTRDGFTYIGVPASALVIKK